ncbi:putative monooxygenase YcnE [Candidatus Phycosocius bacilliformis]|uniref:Putative monooxygenase YcnE n=1 Tax=Candidatus Phycosocius bacilliformis TaxID=1445552 RepID=A0A2P2EAU9_9PROT|nr:putative quinol monooxygenase [Candidatus Phycosocius bacilliformis]GBF58172.1 putative monooxygenase YcnE [Candidatus Phycosocius bacilliformis]
MIGICAQFTIQDGKAAEFEAMLTEFVTTVKAKEPGATVYQLCKNAKAENEYFMLELYADQAALDAHGKTDHMAALVAKIGQFLAGPPKLVQGPALF